MFVNFRGMIFIYFLKAKIEVLTCLNELKSMAANEHSKSIAVGNDLKIA